MSEGARGAGAADRAGPAPARFVAPGGPLAAEIRLLSALPAFTVRDVRAAAAHYRDALGFRVCFTVGEHPTQFSIVDLLPGQGVHLLSHHGERGRFNRDGGGQAIDAYVRIDDADAWHARLAAQGAGLLSAPVDRPWGMREFGLADPDGHVFCFGADTTGAWPAGRLTISPELVVADVGRAAAWWRHVLETEVDTWGEPPVYAIARRDGLALHLSQAPSGGRPGSNRAVDDFWDVYIECRGVDALHAALAKRGVAVLRPPITRDYGMREFEIADLDGYALCFGEEVTPAAGD